jgi:signal transduction histidine kinase/ActR/RegA family two-component response regulator
VRGNELEVFQPIERNGERLGAFYIRARFDAFERVGARAALLVGIALASLFFAAAVFGRLQHTITGPILGVAQAAREVAARQDYGLRVPPSRILEVGILVDAFNGMLDTLQKEMAERRRAEEALRAGDRQKDEFLATLAHELRNPLAPIRQAALLANAPRATEAQRRWSQGVIDRQVRHMALLLDDLLDISRITRGTLQIRKVPTELAAIVNSAVETAQPLIDARGHTLALDLPAAPVALEADPLRVAQVLSNLLANAAKFTPPGGRIEVAARREGAQAVLSVTDSGIGIEAAALPRVFDMFTQLRVEQGSENQGLGIGLALSKGLVDLHGGSVEAFSAGPGTGCRFEVRLPLGAPPHAAAGEEQAAQAAPGAGSALRILVADDNRDAAESLAALLGIDGHELRVVFDGEAALAAALDWRPHVALLDIGMPGLTGLEVAARLREQGARADCTLVAISGWGQAQDKSRALAAGFDHHFTKPVDPARLSALLAGLQAARG